MASQTGLGPSPLNILVIKHGALGDFLISTGGFATLREYHKKDNIILLTRENLVALGKSTGFFDKVIGDPASTALKDFAFFRNLVKEHGIQRVYDFQESQRTQAYALSLFGLNVQWVGKAWGASHRVLESQPPRPYRRSRKLTKAVGITHCLSPTVEWMKDPLPSEFKPKKKQNYIAFIPGCAPNRPEKRWPLERYVALGKNFVEKGFTPVLLGGASEEDIGKAIEKEIPSAINLVSKTKLTQIPSIIRECKGVVGNDTGPIHLAAITGKPTVVLFNAATCNPDHHKPELNNVKILKGHHFNDVTVTRVEKALLSIIKE